MCRLGLFVAAVLSIAAWGQAPAYTAAGIVNASDYSPGPFAPGSVISVFGSNLSRSAYALQTSDIQFPYLPTELNYTQVIVDNSPVALFYVSPTQVNFMVPATDGVGQMTVQVVREGQFGPVVTLPVLNAAPALFVWGSNYALATHGDYSLITAAAPAQAGEIVVLFATGLGKTAPNPGIGEIPTYSAPITNLSTLVVALAGTAVDPTLIKYAGVSPDSAGLYQINLEIPSNAPPNPVILVTVAGQTSAAGLVLPVQ
ncbi:MAG: IPT/TIG domain-containing protein [Bryobacteraceae bacterium]